MEPSWTQAACHDKSVNPELFFAERDENSKTGEARRRRDTAKAKAICASCPIRESLCRPYVMRHLFDVPVLVGFWAGMTYSERRDIRRKIIASGKRPPANVIIEPEYPVNTLAFNPSACGTQAGYMRHRHYDQPPCDPCREAHNKVKREQRAARKLRKQQEAAA